jgi:hypothetical protein
MPVEGVEARNKRNEKGKSGTRGSRSKGTMLGTPGGLYDDGDDDESHEVQADRG